MESFLTKNEGLYLVSIEDHFSSAHQLREYKGKCENLHGHNWKVKATISGKKLDNLGMLLDFTELKKYLKEVLEYLDHKFINDIKPFDKINPSAENIAYFIFEKLSSSINTKHPNISIYQIDVWESPKSCASYKVS